MTDPGRRRRPPPRGGRRRRRPARRSRSGPRRRAAPPPAPKKPEPQRPPKRESGTFEIRKGRSDRTRAEDDDEPLEQIVLPQSITQEAEDGNFVKRFGTERTADLSGVSGKVVLAQSGGALGPDRYIRRRRIVIALLVLLLGGGGAVFAFWPQIKGMLER